jgi:hypothetical protein
MDFQITVGIGILDLLRIIKKKLREREGKLNNKRKSSMTSKRIN